MRCLVCGGELKRKSVCKAYGQPKFRVRYYCESPLCPIIFIDTSGHSNEILHVAVDSIYELPNHLKPKVNAEEVTECVCSFCGEPVSENDVWSLDGKVCCYECGIERSG